MQTIYPFGYKNYMDGKFNANDIDDSDFLKCRKSLVLISITAFIFNTYVVNFNGFELFKIQVSITKTETSIILLVILFYLTIRFLQFRIKLEDSFYIIAKDKAIENALITYAAAKAIKICEINPLTEQERSRVKRRKFIPTRVVLTDNADFAMYPSMRPPQKYKVIVDLKCEDLFIDGGKGGANGLTETVYFNEINVWWRKIIALIMLNVNNSHFIEYNLPICLSIPTLIYTLINHFLSIIA